MFKSYVKVYTFWFFDPGINALPAIFVSLSINFMSYLSCGYHRKSFFFCLRRFFGRAIYNCVNSHSLCVLCRRLSRDLSAIQSSTMNSVSSPARWDHNFSIYLKIWSFGSIRKTWWRRSSTRCVLPQPIGPVTMAIGASLTIFMPSIIYSPFKKWPKS